jgi:hypothetical protein
MARIVCEENWRSLNRTTRDWAHELAGGTTRAALFSAICLTLKGHLDNGGDGSRYVLIIDKGADRVLSPKDPLVWHYLAPLGDRIYVSKEAVNESARRCKMPPPSWCSDVTIGASSPSQPAGQLSLASPAMITCELRSLYLRAQAENKKPPNVKEAAEAVQRALQQKGRWASKRQIQKLAEAEEFKCLRWPPGKRRS